MVAKNTHKASIKPSKSKKSVNTPINSPKEENVNQAPITHKEKSDHDHDISVSSWATLETIMEESDESEDDKSVW